MPEQEANKKNTQLIGPEGSKLPDAESKETTLMISAVEKTINEQWLAKRSDDELIEIIVRVSDELRKRRTTSTQQIAKDDIPAEFRDITEIPLKEYRALPVKSGKLPTSDEKAWYIMLISAEPNHAPMALKIAGDVVIGRGTEGAAPDLDLTAYDPEKSGISRMHALLRPLPDQLIISDLGSTNGTQFDGERLSLGKPQTVTDKGIITLGKLHFQVRITRQPGKSKEKDADKKT